MSERPTVDWEAAGAWAGRLVPAGPTPPAEEARAVVRDLRDAAERARPLAAEASGLDRVVAARWPTAQRARVLVVDRATWARSAGASFAGMADGVTVPGATGQAATLLALLATRVVGQLDPYAAGGPRLLLVAPNVLRTEAALSAPADDFRLWVCAHEQTHALQFEAAPWLAEHLRTGVAELVRDVVRTSPAEEVAAVVRGLAEAVRRGGSGWSVLDVLPPRQRVQVDRLTAVMALLEGHADASMDAVGPRQIPSVAALRRGMEARRSSGAPADVLLRRVLGLDVKLAQYRDGAAFVREVWRVGGHEALDVVWSGPDALPSPAEIADAGAWLRRVG